VEEEVAADGGEVGLHLLDALRWDSAEVVDEVESGVGELPFGYEEGDLIPAKKGGKGQAQEVVAYDRDGAALRIVECVK
jgi:hypothetical protein